MDAAAVIADARSAGLSLEISGGQIIVQPASAISQDLRLRIRAAKPEIVARLQVESELRQELVRLLPGEDHPEFELALDLALKQPEEALRCFKGSKGAA